MLVARVTVMVMVMVTVMVTVIGTAMAAFPLSDLSLDLRMVLP